MNDGPLGNGGDKPGRYNVRLVERAVRNKWPIPAKMKREITTQLVGAFRRTDNIRLQVRIASALAKFDQINVQRETNEVKEQAQQVHQHLHLTQQQALQIEYDPDFYGTLEPPDSEVAPLDASSATDTSRSKSVEGGLLRPKMGENGSGSSGNGEGTRDGDRQT